MLFESQNQIDLRERSPLELAFVGDGVYELLVRARGRMRCECVHYASPELRDRMIVWLENLLVELGINPA